MGKSGAPSIKIGPLEKEQAKFLKGQREGVVEPVQAALLPAALPGAIQAFSTKLEAPDREAIEGQFKQAKNDILAGASGRGGSLRRAMTTQDIARAQTVGQAAVNARQQGIQRSLGLLGPAAFPGANTTVNSGNQLAQLEQQRRADQARLQAQNQSGVGSALGGLVGLGGRFMFGL